MSTANDVAPLWRLVGAVERQALEAWRKENCSHNSLEEAYSSEIARVETTVVRSSGASTLVTISIHARQGWKSHLDVFTLQMVGKGTFKVHQSTLD